MKRGHFITFEGIDGAGKSTHIDTLDAWLVSQGQTVLRTREPGGTPLAESLRELFLHRPMDMLTEALLVFAARRDHIATVIEPALARGVNVLCDRFTDATFAYQGRGRGMSLEVLTTLEGWVQQGLQPDLTCFFDAPPAVAAQRRSLVRNPDRLEVLDEAFFERVRQGYLQRAHAAPARFVTLDAAQGLDAVWSDLRAAIEGRRWWA